MFLIQPSNLNMKFFKSQTSLFLGQKNVNFIQNIPVQNKIYSDFQSFIWLV